MHRDHPPRKRSFSGAGPRARLFASLAGVFALSWLAPEVQAQSSGAPSCTASPPVRDGSWNGLYDFSFQSYGPHHVTAGYDLYLALAGRVTAGSRDYVFYDVQGMPPGSTVSYPQLEETCCGENRGWMPEETLLRIQVPPGAREGSYPLRISARSGGVTKQACHVMVVDGIAPALSQAQALAQLAAVPPIPRLEEWESNMLTIGGQLCDRDRIASLGLSETNVWYYDGIRVFYQIADYTRDPFWSSCAGYVKPVYRPYALGGRVPGWRVFPHGLRMDFARSGQTASRDAVFELSENSAWSSTGGGVHPDLVRETAYLVHAHRIAGALGNPHPHYSRSIDFLLGHLDQWFVSRTVRYMQPFMVGLAAEALIQHHEATGDPRVPGAIRTAMDALWNWAWVPADRAFFYESTSNTSRGEPDLNLLIAPAFAWLYSKTGNPVYQQRGDLIFQGGVDGAWLDQGKQFSQNYRWSFDYVKWRSNPGQTPPPPPDTQPPVLSGGGPTGTLPSGSTEALVRLRTDERASCAYSGTPGTPFGSMPHPLATSDGRAHSVRVNGLVDGRSYRYYLRCRDSRGNANRNDYSVTFQVGSAGPSPAPPPGTDRTPPDIRRVTASWSVLRHSPMKVMRLKLITDENAVCAYSQAQGTAFSRMQGRFQATGRTHSAEILRSNGASSYKVYVRCRDAAGNANQVDREIAFVQSTESPSLGPEVRFVRAEWLKGKSTPRMLLALRTRRAAVCAIGRNVRIPFEQMRLFTTTGDYGHSIDATSFSSAGSQLAAGVRCREEGSTMGAARNGLWLSVREAGSQAVPDTNGPR